MSKHKKPKTKPTVFILPGMTATARRRIEVKCDIPDIPPWIYVGTTIRVTKDNLSFLEDNDDLFHFHSPKQNKEPKQSPPNHFLLNLASGANF